MPRCIRDQGFPVDRPPSRIRGIVCGLRITRDVVSNSSDASTWRVYQKALARCLERLTFSSFEGLRVYMHFGCVGAIPPQRVCIIIILHYFTQYPTNILNATYNSVHLSETLHITIATTTTSACRRMNTRNTGLKNLYIRLSCTIVHLSETCNARNSTLLLLLNITIRSRHGCRSGQLSKE